MPAVFVGAAATTESGVIAPGDSDSGDIESDANEPAETED